jgi:hypothetical protein
MLLSHVLCITLTALLCLRAANAACGATLLQQNFDEFQGGYQQLNKDLAKRAFSAGNQASLGSGYNTGPGLVFLKQASQGEVGTGHLKSVLPAGTLHLVSDSICPYCAMWVRCHLCH